MTEGIPFRRLLKYLWTEEMRVQKTMTGGPAFYFFPIILCVFGFILGAAHAILLEAISFETQLTVGGLMFLVFGLGVGGMGLFIGEILERRFGSISLLLGSGRLLPVTNRSLVGAFFLKDAAFYLLFNILPFALSFSLSGYFWAEFSLRGITAFCAGMVLTFFFGMSLSYVLSMLAARSRPLSLGLVLILVAVILTTLWGYIPGGLFLPIVSLVTGEDSYLVIPTCVLTVLFVYLGTGMTMEQVSYKHMTYKNALLSSTESFRRFSRYAPILAKEWLDLRRSGTLGPVVGSFIGPILLFVSLNWFLVAVSGGDFDFPPTFFAPLVGFFCITTYSWLNNIDDPGFYMAVPVRLPDVIMAKVILFFMLIAILPGIFVILISMVSDDFSGFWISLFMAYTTAIYVLAITVYLTGVRTNSMLFDARILTLFCLMVVPPLLTLSFLSISVDSIWIQADMASALACLVLLMLSALFFRRIRQKWSKVSFD